jgi:outer membrane protein OmpA-like peptidoglycan-associated protein
VKLAVLTRIDLMPNISDSNKDKLYNSVERARSMGQVLTVPFGSGKTSLGAAEIQSLQEALQNPELAKLRDDPTAVFVILGFADPKGDAKKNLDFSQARADTVMNAMRDKAGVMNVMHAVGMGGSTLLDSENLEKNRIAEVWVVLP